ncbi:glycolate oxidase, subunit GlcD [compost metagenome]
MVPLLHAAYDGVRPVIFGHCADGNLHFNVSRPPGWSTADWQETDRINDIVLDAVARYRGSFSAEHELGQLRRNAMLRYKAPLEREVMRKIKQALDPEALMNPARSSTDRAAWSGGQCARCLCATACAVMDRHYQWQNMRTADRPYCTDYLSCV